MTQTEALRLAHEGVEIHSPNTPEYKVFAALIAEYRKKDSVIYGVDWGTTGDMPCVSIIKQLPDGKIEILAVEYGPQRTWVGLTDEELQDLMDVVDHYNFPEDLITYTQAKLKEKNT